MGARGGSGSSEEAPWYQVGQADQSVGLELGKEITAGDRF